MALVIGRVPVHGGTVDRFDRRAGTAPSRDWLGQHDDALVADVRSLARPLTDERDLDGLVAALAPNRFVALGEASHGTHEYYRWRAAITRRLIEEHGFTWIGVEGDWPDCWRLNRWVRGLAATELDATDVLRQFTRWPTWMWANRDVAEFLTWLRDYNSRREPKNRVGFYGLDVYSLWDSLWEIVRWLDVHAPDAVETAMQAWECFAPYGEDPHAYARATTRLVPASCEGDVVNLLVEVRSRTLGRTDDEDAFDAAQNAEAAAGAERYYRAMVSGGRTSWNVRDIHMADTVDRVAAHHGANSRGVIWEHNTHVGDARATDMARAGMVNVGQLLRERHAADGVALIGFAGRGGSVIAASAWGAAERVFPVPNARPSSHEALLHDALDHDAVIDFGTSRSNHPWLSARLGHRAIGVVYDPNRESGNFVPTTMGERYDALLWFENTAALVPIHHEAPPVEPELETEPFGY